MLLRRLNPFLFCDEIIECVICGRIYEKWSVTMPLPSPASRQQCSWDTVEGLKHTSKDWSVIDKTLQFGPLCTSQVRNKQICTVELGYNIMRRERIFCHYKQVLL